MAAKKRWDRPPPIAKKKKVNPLRKITVWNHRPPAKKAPAKAAVARRVGAAPAAAAPMAAPGILSSAPVSPQGSNLSAAPEASSSSYSPEQEAKDTLDQEYGPKIAALLRAKSGVGSEHTALTGATQQYGAGFDGKLAEIYAQLRTQLEQGYAKTADSYTQAQGTVQGAHQAAGAAIQQAGAAGKADVQGTANRLGLEAGMAPVQDKLSEFLALAQTQNAQSQSQSLANLGANKQSALDFTQGGINSAATEGAGARAELVKAVSGQLGGLNLQRLKSEGEIQAQLSDLETQKASALRTLVEKIKTSRAEAEREAAKEEFARQIQQNTMDIQLAKLGMAREKQSFDMEDSVIDNSRASQQLAATLRGQDLAHQDRVANTNVAKAKAGITSSTSGLKAKAPKLSAQQKKQQQQRVSANVRKFASKPTQDAFFAILTDNPTVRTAEVALKNTTDAYLKKNKINRKTLETWVRSYYRYT